MRPPTQVCLFGSLRKRLGDRKDLSIQLDLKSPTPLTEVLETLEIPSDAVQLSMVNYRAVPRDTTIYPGDSTTGLSPRTPQSTRGIDCLCSPKNTLYLWIGMTFDSEMHPSTHH
jgi:hypothetical protein